MNCEKLNDKQIKICHLKTLIKMMEKIGRKLKLEMLVFKLSKLLTC